jgi:hypothetical protein
MDEERMSWFIFPVFLPGVLVDLSLDSRLYWASKKKLYHLVRQCIIWLWVTTGLTFVAVLFLALSTVVWRSAGIGTHGNRTQPIHSSCQSGAMP